ncbi:MAG: sigma-70 family RNA polymerase sigma factor [Rikenellaceae bacterium]|nr:sigma-70 family RNA polymerase sigma factor [Rikenellaceae bacterium]
MTEKEIIEGCRRGDPLSQRELYMRFSSLMYGVCLRYVKDRSLAEDIMHDGFITIFTKIGEFRGEGSFEGWCRRIFVNTALGHLRKKNALDESDNIDDIRWLEGGGTDAVEKMSGDELLEVIDHLPQGYRTILNLYAVEGYSHKEIGEMLGISENTSRSQYFRARGKLMEIIGQER